MPGCDHCGADARHTTAQHDAAEQACEEDPQTVDELLDEVVDPGVAHTSGDPLGDIVIGVHERSPDDVARGDLKKRYSNPRELPEILLGPALAENIDEAVDALREDPDVFTRDHKLLHVTRVTREESSASPEVRPGRRALVEGTPRLHTMSQATLMERLTRVAIFLRINRRSLLATHPTKPVVEGLYDRKVWPGLRPIVGIAEAPFLRADGSVCQTRGYDAETGYLYEPSCAFPRIPEKPSREDAREALKSLESVYVDFPWQPAEHRAVPVSAVLTILARPAIAGAIPAVLFSANTPGTGKGLCTDTIAMIASGRPMPRATYPVHQEEQEKMLGGFARQGCAFLNLDEITTPFGGAPLNKYITAQDAVDIRVLGLTEIARVPWRALLVGTGNNIELSGDMAPRVLFARMKSDLEDPRSRTGFAHDDLLPWILAHRGALVAAALTVLRAYCAAGRPKVEGCARWGSFESWSNLIPPAIVWAGGSDPMSARIRDATKVNEELRHLVTVMRGIRGMHRQLARTRAGLSAKEIIEALYRPENLHAPHLNDLRGALEALCLPKQQRGDQHPSHQILGYKLRGYTERVIDGQRLLSVPDRKGIALWTVEDVAANG